MKFNASLKVLLLQLFCILVLLANVVSADTANPAIAGSERQQGFWFSSGDSDAKRRLPSPLEIDVPLHQQRSVYLGINALKDLQDVNLQVNFKDIPSDLVETAWEVHGADSYRVLPFVGSTKIHIANGGEGRLWLTLKGGDAAREANGQIEISVDGQKVLLPLRVKVWPVDIPTSRPFHIRGYGTYPSALNDTHAITPESLKRVDAYMAAFAAVGGDTFDFTVAWSALDPRLKIAGSDQSVSDWIKKNLAVYRDKPLSDWPQIDFSYCNPWTELAQKHGLTRVVTFLPLRTAADNLLEQEWRLIQLKKYFQENHFTGYFCKIGDEISRGDIPDYIEQAKVARSAGWRPFTSVTGQVGSTSSGINSINDYLDEWHLNLAATDFFNTALYKLQQLETRVAEMPSKWKPYTNGGAQNTLTQAFFTKVIPEYPLDVDDLEIFQDGKPLQCPLGSATGNKQRGVFFRGHYEIYVSPFKGTDANTSKFTVKYQVPVPDPQGKPLAKIDSTDVIWFYGGGSSPYKNSYGYGASYPLFALQGKYDGFGWYAFHSAGNSRIFWYDDKTGKVDISPPYLGLRDGWNDALLMAWLQQSHAGIIDRMISEKPDAPLHIGKKRNGAYRWKTIVNITDPFILNEARKKILELATK